MCVLCFWIDIKDKVGFFMSDIGCFFVRLKIKDCNEFLFWNVKVDVRFKYCFRMDLIKMYMKIYLFIC